MGSGRLMRDLVDGHLAAEEFALDVVPEDDVQRVGDLFRVRVRVRVSVRVRVRVRVRLGFVTTCYLLLPSAQHVYNKRVEKDLTCGLIEMVDEAFAMYQEYVLRSNSS